MYLPDAFLFRVIPAKAGIQYSPAFTGSPLSRGWPVL